MIAIFSQKMPVNVHMWPVSVCFSLSKASMNLLMEAKPGKEEELTCSSSSSYLYGFLAKCLVFHSVHPLVLPAWGLEPPTKFSKRGRLDMISIFRGGDFFQGDGMQFSHKK